MKKTIILFLVLAFFVSGCGKKEEVKVEKKEEVIETIKKENNYNLTSFNSIRDVGFDFDLNLNYPDNWFYGEDSNTRGGNNYGNVNFFYDNNGDNKCSSTGCEWKFKIKVTTGKISYPADYDKKIVIDGYEGYLFNNVGIYDNFVNSADWQIIKNSYNLTIDKNKLMKFVISDLPRRRFIEIYMENKKESDQDLFLEIINSISLNNVNTEFIIAEEKDRCDSGIFNRTDGIKEFYDKCYNIKFSFQDKKNKIKPFKTTKTHWGNGFSRFNINIFHKEDSEEHISSRLHVGFSDNTFSDEQSLREVIKEVCSRFDNIPQEDCANEKITSFKNGNGIEFFKVGENSYHAVYNIDNKYAKSIEIGGSDKELIKQILDSFVFFE